MIWVGVVPDSLAGEDAFNSANALLALLKDEGIADVDIEFRESVFRRSVSAELYEPASDLDATRHVIDPLTTALGLTITAAKMPHLQGTMGFYFQEGDNLYGVTARHVLFPADEYNSDYTYNPSRPRKKSPPHGHQGVGLLSQVRPDPDRKPGHSGGDPRGVD